MRIGTHWILISAVAFLATAVLVLLFMPAAAWSPLTAYASVVFVLSVGSAFLFPFTKSRDANLGLLGPVGIFSVFFVGASFSTLFVSVAREGVFAYALNVLNTAFGLIGFLVLNISSKIIQKEISRNDQKGFQSFIEYELLQIALLVADTGFKKQIQKLADDARFSPRATIADDDQNQSEVRIRLDELRRIAGTDNVERLEEALEALKTSIKTHKARVNFYNSKA